MTMFGYSLNPPTPIMPRTFTTPFTLSNAFGLKKAVDVLKVFPHYETFARRNFFEKKYQQIDISENMFQVDKKQFSSRMSNPSGYFSAL